MNEALVQALMKDVGITRRTVIKSLRELEARGYIKLNERGCEIIWPDILPDEGAEKDESN